MDITLKAIHYHPALSQETPCFSASLYINGTRRGVVSNSGTGGAYQFSDRQAEKEIDDWARTQPPVVHQGQSLTPCAELVIGSILDQMLLAQLRIRTARAMVRTLKRRAQGAELIVVGQRLVGDEIKVEAELACREALAKTLAALADRGASAFDVYTRMGTLLESTGELR